MSSSIALSAVTPLTSPNPGERGEGALGQVLRSPGAKLVRSLSLETLASEGRLSSRPLGGRQEGEVVAFSGRSRRLAVLTDATRGAQELAGSEVWLGPKGENDAVFTAASAGAPDEDTEPGVEGREADERTEGVAENALPVTAEGGGARGPTTTAEGDPEKQAAESAPPGQETMSPEERQRLSELEKRDREVRAHEEAHRAAGGGLTGPVQLDLERGPDGASYAVNGSVAIDVSAVKGDPAATVAKMRRVVAAATAPSNPSGADLQVAARATARMGEAMKELAKKRFEEMQGGAEGASASGLSVTA